MTSSRGSDYALSYVADLDRLFAARGEVIGLLDRTAVLRETARSIREGTSLDLGFASAVESDDVMVIRGWAGDTAGGLRNIEVPRGMGLGGKAYALGAPAWVADYCGSGEITHEYDTLVRAEGIGAMVAVPLVYRGLTVGIAYGAQRGGAQMGDRLLGQLKTIAVPAGTALQLAQHASGQTSTALATERQRIALALHDSVGALLFSIGAQVRDLQVDAGAPPHLVAKLRAVEARVAETAAAFRESLAVLDEVTPDQSLTAALRADCDAFTRRTEVTARCVALTDAPNLDATRCGALVAVVREALVNVEKHARAASVVVSIVASKQGITVAVADDGLGWAEAAAGHAALISDFDAGSDRAGTAGASTRMGLKASHDRLARLGGQLSVVGNEDGGLTMRAWLPAV